MSPGGAKRPSRNPTSSTFKREEESPGGAKRPGREAASSTVKRAEWRRAGAALLAGVLGLGTGCAAAQERSALIARGEQLFVEQGCHGCHTVGKLGTPLAGDLSGIGVKYPEAYLGQWLRDPAVQKPTAHMPRITLSDSEVRALAAYLTSLREANGRMRP